MSVFIASTTTLITAGAIIKMPELICFAFIIASTGMISELKQRNGIQRIGGYIRQFIEPNIDGLQWETITELIYPIKPIGVFRKLIRTIFSVYGLICIGTILLSIVFYLEYTLENIFRQILYWSIFIVGLFNLITAMKLSLSRQTGRIFWNDAFSKLREEKINQFKFQSKNNI